jgi:DNA-binding winged helix-turn-helix (wHTH) protein/TolB-like protein/Flp pilus assembly protein TadD
MTLTARRIYEFGPFRLDVRERQLLRTGRVVPLTPKVFDTLLVLVENSGHLLSKDEVMKIVWPDATVEEANLTKNISTLRKALGQTPEGNQYIETIPWHGYRFVANVREAEDEIAHLIIEEHTRSRVLIEREQETSASTANVLLESDAGKESIEPGSKIKAGTNRRIKLLALVAATLIAVTAGILLLTTRKHIRTAPPIRSVAVLPFKSLSPEAADQYLGLGMADTLITRLSNIRQLIVRPTSAVRRYMDESQDPIAAGREQHVDAVLEGSIHKADGRIRLTARLINVQDGSSLWAGSFDEENEKIFKLQDSIVKRLAASLTATLTGEEQRGLSRRYTSDQEAYRYYSKAMYHFYNIGPDLRTRSESELAVDLFNKAIELDWEYALAHAHLGYAYVKKAVFQEDDPALIEQARKELAIAEGLDPQLAEVHSARFFIAFSQYQGWQVETAYRELRLAQQLNPNVGHLELGDLFNHIGLEEKAIAEYDTALDLDPNNDEIKNAYVNQFSISGRPDEALAASQRLFNRGPDPRYYMEKMMVKEAAPLVEGEYQKNPAREWVRGTRALLMALQGKYQEAEPIILEKTRNYRGYHHLTYDAARIYALWGKSEQAVKWLRVTVKEGFPCYPLFARDPYLNSIRNDPAFIQFIAEMKERWEGYQRELG